MNGNLLFNIIIKIHYPRFVKNFFHFALKIGFFGSRYPDEIFGTIYRMTTPFCMGVRDKAQAPLKTQSIMVRWQAKRDTAFIPVALESNTMLPLTGVT